MAQANLINIKRRKKKSNDPYARGDFNRQAPSQYSRKYKKPAIYGVNLVLAILLLFSMLVSAIIYFGVISKENRIKKLHAYTNKLNYENIDLQNRVDYLKSFYVIDHKVRNINFLKKPDKVMEVKEKVNNNAVHDKEKFGNIIPVSGY